MYTYLWLFFIVLIVTLLIIDLFVIHKKSRPVTLRNSIIETLIWIAIALGFNMVIYYTLGSKSAGDFLTAYLVEKSLSVDNLFVFQLIFAYYAVPQKSQYKVLFWGIIGTVAMRAIFIFFGVKLIESFDFLLYGLGLFLVYAGTKLLWGKENKLDPKNSFIVKWIKKIVPVFKNYHDDNFIVVRNWKFYVTPLFIVLIVIETTDIIFALDSIPAVLGITIDPFIVYTSNIFAILGLRALYFSLAGIMGLFHLLKYGLGLILIFIGLKIFSEELYPIDSTYSLVAVLMILTISIILSMMVPPKQLKNTNI